MIVPPSTITLPGAEPVTVADDEAPAPTVNPNVAHAMFVVPGTVSVPPLEPNENALANVPDTMLTVDEAEAVIEPCNEAAPVRVMAEPAVVIVAVPEPNVEAPVTVMDPPFMKA